MLMQSHPLSPPKFQVNIKVQLHVSLSYDYDFIYKQKYAYLKPNKTEK